MNVSVAGSTYAYHPNEIVDIDEHRGNAWIESGTARQPDPVAKDEAELRADGWIKPDELDIAARERLQQVTEEQLTAAGWVRGDHVERMIEERLAAATAKVPETPATETETKPTEATENASANDAGKNKRAKETR